MAIRNPVPRLTRPKASVDAWPAGTYLSKASTDASRWPQTRQVVAGIADVFIVTVTPGQVEKVQY